MHRFETVHTYHTRFSMRKTISKNDPLFPQRKDIALLLNIFIGSSGWRSQPPNLRHQSGGTLGKLTLPRNIFGSCLSISGRICSCTISLGVAGGVTKRTGANFARNDVRKVRWGWRFRGNQQADAARERGENLWMKWFLSPISSAGWIVHQQRFVVEASLLVNLFRRIPGWWW